MRRPTELEVLPVGYHALFDRARRRFERDERVRGVWLGGSLGRGTADAASDLDLVLAVLDDAFEEFAGSWRTWLADITPTVLAEELPYARGIIYSVTPDFERLDLVIEPVSALPTTLFRSRVPVIDKDRLSEALPAAETGAGPSREAVAGLITEYFRISAVETILVRDDWLLAREHLHVVGSLIYRLFVEANAPLPPMGVKQWSARLTAAQQDALRSLPTAAVNIDELREAQLAMASVFLPNAEAMARRLGVEWPTELEAAAAAHLRAHLAIDDPHPRGGPVVVG